MSLSTSFTRFICLSLLLITVRAYDCPFWECDYCVPVEVREAHGVGFDLTTSYGTSAVHFYNGSIVDVAREVASPTYLNLLRRLSLSSKTPEPSMLQRYLRRINKSLGRPPTKDIGTLSELISSLRAAVELQLNQTLDRVVVTTPQFPGLTKDDLRDAIEYAGLKSGLEYSLPYPAMLYAPNAAFAANGRGLCKEWRNLYACLEEAEEGEIPSENVHTVTLSALDSYSSPTVYWNEVRNQLQSLPREAAEQGHPISALVLLGESVDDNDFTKMLKDALRGIGATTALTGKTSKEKTQQNATTEEFIGVPIKQVSRSPVWDAARGAALYARIRQELPLDCMEPEECLGKATHAMDREKQRILRKDKTELK